MTEITEKRTQVERKDYTDQEIDAGLTAFAICSGRRDRAAELLKAETGLEVAPTTLRDWAGRTYPDRYQRIREEVAPKLQRHMADTHQALADMAAEIEAEAVEKLQKRIQTGDVEDKDLGNIFKNAAIAGGIHTEKAELLNGRPTQRAERSAAEIMRSLKRRGVKVNGQMVEEETEVTEVLA